jgi:hypothetical protein
MIEGTGAFNIAYGRWHLLNYVAHYNIKSARMDINRDPDFSDLENPDLGPRFGIPIWDPDLGPRFGTPIWDPDLGPRFGTRFETPIWDPDLGP